jgi:hypothetical protein
MWYAKKIQYLKVDFRSSGPLDYSVWWWAMPIWKLGPLLDVAVPIVAESVTQLNFMLNYSLWTFQSFLVSSITYLSIIYSY